MRLFRRKNVKLQEKMQELQRQQQQRQRQRRELRFATLQLRRRRFLGSRLAVDPTNLFCRTK